MTEAGKKKLPNWLIFESDTRTFLGVPTLANIGQYYIEVIAMSPNQDVAKDVFSIHVTKENKPISAMKPLKSSSSGLAPFVRCSPGEAETAFTLIVDADMTLLSPHSIVGLLKDLEQHLQLASEMFKVSPAGNKPLFDTSALVSGPGNTKTPKHPGILVTWLVGCGKVEPPHMPVLQKIETTSANGSLSDAIKHGIIGWQVTNNKIQEKRVRRAIMTTPSIGSLPTSMTRYHGNDAMTHQVPTMASPIVPSTRTHQRSKTRHPEATSTYLHPSTFETTEGVLPKTKTLPDGMYTITTGSIEPTRVDPGLEPTKPTPPMTKLPQQCMTGKDDRPMVEKGIPPVEVVAGQIMKFKVPPDTFMDCEDGNTENLRLDFFLENYKRIPQDYWLKAENKRQMVIGLPLPSDVGLHNMSVVALDTGGFKEFLDFNFKVVNDPNMPQDKITHKITMVIDMSYNKFMSEISNRLNVMKKIARLYGDKNPSKISVLDIGQGSVVFSWTNNTLVSDKCPKEETKQLLMKLVDADKQVTDMAKKALKPFKLLSAQITPMGPCSEDYSVVLVSSTPVMTVSDKPVHTHKEETDDDILISTVVPAVIIVSILLLALLVACILYRKKRKGKMSLTEQTEYAGKGAPVIFADELDEKPTDCSRPLILDEEKPPHPPPEYQQSSSDSNQSTPHQDRRGENEINLPDSTSPLYEPPPPVTASRVNKQPRPHVQPPYRTPPPYVPP